MKIISTLLPRYDTILFKEGGLSFLGRTDTPTGGWVRWAVGVGLVIHMPAFEMNEKVP